MLTNKKVALVSSQLIRLLEMCKRQTDNHTGLDPVARKNIQNIISIQILEYVTNKLAIVCLISKIRICDDYIAP